MTVTITKKRKSATITKKTLNELVSGLDQSKVDALFLTKDSKSAPMQSKSKLISELKLNASQAKAINDFVYPLKSKKAISELSANQLTNSIKALNDKITKLQEEKKEYKDALDAKLK